MASVEENVLVVGKKADDRVLVGMIRERWVKIWEGGGGGDDGVVCGGSK